MRLVRSTMQLRPRLLLADDHPDTAELLRALVQPECDVVAVVGDGRSLISAAERLSPDVIVSDVSMPGLDGITAAAAILLRNPESRIIFVTVHGDPLMVTRALATGALGYVLKVLAGDDLMPAVRSVLRGERHVSQALHFADETADRHVSGHELK
jgi:DNA-binding NarL/FixJ family response regulator